MNFRYTCEYCIYLHQEREGGLEPNDLPFHVFPSTIFLPHTLTHLYTQSLAHLSTHTLTSAHILFDPSTHLQAHMAPYCVVTNYIHAQLPLCRLPKRLHALIRRPLARANDIHRRHAPMI